MRIALAQTNSHLGDFAKNSEKIIDNIRRAKERRCDIVLFSEATLFGYHPMDLLERASVVKEQARYIQRIYQSMPEGVLAVFGAFTVNRSKHGKPYFNSALAVQKGQPIWACHKELLPTYDVFDDARHIEPGNMKNNILKFKGKKILITICEDIWAWPVAGSKRESYYEDNPIKKIKPKDVDLILNLSASPFFLNKMKNRLFVTRETVRYLKAPMVYVNMVGGQDELIFDGGSFALDSKGNVVAQAAQFAEDLIVIDFSIGEGSARPLVGNPVESLRQALVLGIRDFVQKSGQTSALLGLSGGIDSAVVACLAVDALGPSRVRALAMPGPHSSPLSLQLAKRLAKSLGISLRVVPVKKAYRQLLSDIEASLGAKKFGLMNENLQARIRGVFLMASSNRDGGLVLNTSNKSELAAGYGTLYGDLVGGLSPVGDLLKRDVYALARHYNEELEVIPKKIIQRAPTAELAPNQRDQDSLPPYPQLDDAVVNLVEKSKPAKTAAEKFLLRALVKSEFKRWQAPPILKVREHSFGQGRRLPIAHKATY
jgi:NAD+ synthase (glutamine-hydrolysing)